MIYRLEERVGYLLFLALYGATVYRLDLEAARLSVIASLHRSPDDEVGLYRTRLYEIGEDTLISYEGGYFEFLPAELLFGTSLIRSRSNGISWSWTTRLRGMKASEKGGGDIGCRTGLRWGFGKNVVLPHKRHVR